MGQFRYNWYLVIEKSYGGILFYRVSSGLADEIEDSVPVPSDFVTFPKGVKEGATPSKTVCSGLRIEFGETRGDQVPSGDDFEVCFHKGVIKYSLVGACEIPVPCIQVPLNLKVSLPHQHVGRFLQGIS